MSEDPAGNHPDLTVAALKALLEAKIDALDRLTDSKFVTFRTLVDAEAARVALALSSSDKAVTKAETATEKRFENVDEFRVQLGDQAATFMTRSETEAIQARNTERIQDLTDRMNRADGKNTGSHTTWATALVVATVVISLVVFLADLFFHS